MSLAQAIRERLKSLRAGAREASEGPYEADCFDEEFTYEQGVLTACDAVEAVLEASDES